MERDASRSVHSLLGVHQPNAEVALRNCRLDISVAAHAVCRHGQVLGEEAALGGYHLTAAVALLARCQGRIAVDLPQPRPDAMFGVCKIGVAK
ncbi:MAG: hypothetical protein ACRDKL_06200, partial [Solirubrobacteraceae bacterium]